MISARTIVNTRKRKITLIVGLLLLLLALGYWFFIYDTNKTSEYERELDQIGANMQNAAITDGVPSTVFLEIQKTVQAKKYADAKKQLDKLGSEGLNANNQQMLHSLLAAVCLPLKDFGCVDKVVAFQKANNTLDVYFVVDAAKLADKAGNTAKKKEYYAIALETIDANGGEAFVKSANEVAEVKLDYAKIKAGAQ